MNHAYEATRHARDRSTARAIPPMIAEIILEFGQSRDAGDGARKYALTKEGMRELRRSGGREITKAVEPYRKRNAYVVATEGRIVTVAYASTKIFK
jgi:hypothetical protein